MDVISLGQISLQSRLYIQMSAWQLHLDITKASSLSVFKGSVSTLSIPPSLFFLRFSTLAFGMISFPKTEASRSPLKYFFLPSCAAVIKPSWHHLLNWFWIYPLLCTNTATIPLHEPSLPWPSYTSFYRSLSPCTFFGELFSHINLCNCVMMSLMSFLSNWNVSSTRTGTMLVFLIHSLCPSSIMPSVQKAA